MARRSSHQSRHYCASTSIKGGAATCQVCWPCGHAPLWLTRLADLAGGAASPAAAVAAVIAAPVLSLLLIWVALSHSTPPVRKPTPQVEGIGVLGIIVPSVPGGADDWLPDVVERLYDQVRPADLPNTALQLETCGSRRVATLPLSCVRACGVSVPFAQRKKLHNPGSVEVFVGYSGAGGASEHEPFAQVRGNVEWSRRVRNHPGFFFHSNDNVVANAGLDGRGVQRQQTLRFQGWHFRRGTNARLQFIDVDGRLDVLELSGFKAAGAAHTYQTIDTIPGVKYLVHYDVWAGTLPPDDDVAADQATEPVVLEKLQQPTPAAAAAAPCSHSAAESGGPSWCGWQNSMLLISSGSAEQRPQPPSATTSAAAAAGATSSPPSGLLLQLHPPSVPTRPTVAAENEAEVAEKSAVILETPTQYGRWIRLHGSFIADAKTATLALHSAAGGQSAIFDQLSVRPAAHQHDDHHLIYRARGCCPSPPLPSFHPSSTLRFRSFCCAYCSFCLCCRAPFPPSFSSSSALLSSCYSCLALFILPPSFSLSFAVVHRACVHLTTFRHCVAMFTHSHRCQLHSLFRGGSPTQSASVYTSFCRGTPTNLRFCSISISLMMIMARAILAQNECLKHFT
eukprot:COSAG05_NODE_722_length_7764_cov_6.682322_7_plen_623_part_00